MAKNIDQMIQKYLTQQLTRDEFVELNQWISEGRQNAKYFAKECFVDQSLRDYFSGQRFVTSAEFATLLDSMKSGEQFPVLELSEQKSGDSSSVPELNASSIKTTARQSYSHAAVISLSLVVLLAVGLFLSSLMFQPNSSRIVRIVDYRDILWQPGSEVPDNSVLSPGMNYHLEKGWVLLETANQAQVVVQGPAQFRFADAMQLDVEAGSVVVFCGSPESHGFLVQIPDGMIEDLGTEFGVSVDTKRQSTVHVFQGEIRVSLASESRSVQSQLELEVGETCLVTEARIRQLDKNLVEFLRPRELYQQSVSRIDLGTVSYRAYCQKLQTDPSLIFWTDFTTSTHRGDWVNYASPAQTVRTDLRDDQNTGPGRFLTGAALNVSRVDQLTSVDLQSESRELTLAAWVKLNPESQDDQRHRSLLMSGLWEETGEVHWQVKGDDFRVSFRVENEDQWDVYPAQMIPDRNEWVLLTTVLKLTGEPSVTHYLNGKLASRNSIKHPPASFSLKGMDIGNWKQESSPAYSRYLNGLIDEAFIWNRALSHAEVQELFHTTAP